MTRPSARAGFGLGDLLLGLSLLALGVALALPVLRRAAFEREIQRTVAAVDTVRAAADRFRFERGAWPAPDPRGGLGADLERAVSDAAPRGPTAGRLAWHVWEEVIPPPEEPVDEDDEELATGTEPQRPPPARVEILGAVSVTSADGRILAALLSHYGPLRSFVRDSTWTLMLRPPGR